MVTRFVAYIGGKVSLLHFILSHFPKKYKIYVEVFGGSGAILLNKKPSEIECYNDKNEYLYNLFKVVRDIEKFKKLMHMLNYSLYSRKEFNESKQRLRENKYTDDVLKAYDYFLVLRQGNKPGKIGDNNFGIRLSKNQTHCYFNIISELNAIHNRLKNVIIECLDFREIIKRYSSNDTFFYLDPPYLLDGKANDYYEDKFTEKDHEELVNLIIKYSNETKSKFLLSGYDNKIYKKLLSYDFRASVIEKTNFCDVIGKEKKRSRKKVKEYLWYNYPVHKTLFEYENFQTIPSIPILNFLK